MYVQVSTAPSRAVARLVATMVAQLRVLLSALACACVWAPLCVRTATRVATLDELLTAVDEGVDVIVLTSHIFVTCPDPFTPQPASPCNTLDFKASPRAVVVRRSSCIKSLVQTRVHNPSAIE